MSGAVATGIVLCICPSVQQWYYTKRYGEHGCEACCGADTCRFDCGWVEETTKEFEEDLQRRRIAAARKLQRRRNIIAKQVERSKGMVIGETDKVGGFVKGKIVGGVRGIGDGVKGLGRNISLRGEGRDTAVIRRDFAASERDREKDIVEELDEMIGENEGRRPESQGRDIVEELDEMIDQLEAVIGMHPIGSGERTSEEEGASITGKAKVHD